MAGTDVTPLIPAELAATLPHWAQVAILIGVTYVGGYLQSVAVSFWSDYVRRLGKQAKPWHLAMSSALNLVAGNPHKAARAKKASDAAKAAES